MMTDVTKNFILEDCRVSCIDPEKFIAIKGKSVLVTGGTGFMGKWIAEMISFINETQQTQIKLHLLGRDIQKFSQEVPHLAEKSFITLIEQDVRSTHDLPDVNFIIHAAGSPDNREHVSQPLRTLDTFYKGTQTILDAATRLTNLQKIIHISSHTVYGDNDKDVLIAEDFLGKTQTSAITHVYGEAKKVSETLCSIYRAQFKLPIVVVRPFAFIGPYQHLDKPWAINNFIRDGILGGPIRILGNGKTVRSYLYASDMAYWLLSLMIKGDVGQSFNLGSNEGISLDDLAFLVKDSFSGEIEILSRSSKEIYTAFSKLVPDVTKIVESLKITQTYNLDAALKRTIVWNQLNRK